MLEVSGSLPGLFFFFGGQNHIDKSSLGAAPVTRMESSNMAFRKIQGKLGSCSQHSSAFNTQIVISTSFVRVN